MILSLKASLLLSTLLGAIFPAVAGDGGGGHDARRGHGHTGAQDRYVDVPGWRLPAQRMLPPVGYSARPLPGDEPAYRDDRGISPHSVRGVRYNHHSHGRTHAVRDYRGHGLRPPPRGYYWRTDGRGTYLLVAIATGVVAGVVQQGG